MPLHFDDFAIDLEGCRLLRGGQEVPLEPRALDLLCYLATRPGELVRKDELLWHVWRARTLSEGVLSNTIGKVRKALGQGSHELGPIETVRGRGYRWRAQPALSASAPVEPRPLRAAEVEPFVGRHAGIEQLEGALEAAAQSGGRLLWIAAEAGAGKTCMLGQLAMRARARGFSVWRGAGYAGAGTPAYWPWVEVLREARAELGEQWRAHWPERAPALAKLAPELAASDVDDTASRFELFDELRQFLESASTSAPRLLLLDDLHWADAASIELLAYAARSLEGRPLVLAGALRDHDPALTPAHAAAIVRLERCAERVGLPALTLEEVGALVAALRGAPVTDAGLIARLHARSQGNPFFVRQMVALGPQLTAASLESLRLPAAVRELLLQRVGAPGSRARMSLAAAAAIGQTFDAGLLASVLDHTLAETLAALEPARGAGVLERSCAVPQEYAFSHALLHEVLYEELPWAERGVLHAKLAQALAARPLSDARHLGEVARHYLLAVPSQLEPCLSACCRAADAAREASGFEAAAELVSHALRKLEREGSDPHTYGELLLTLGFDQLCSGDRTTAWETLERGAELAHQRGDARLMVGFACRMADWVEAIGDEEVALRQLDRALAMLPEDDAEQRALTLARRARLDHTLSGEARIALLNEAETLAARSVEPGIAIEVAFSRAQLRDPVRPELNYAAAARYRELAERHPAACSGMLRRLRRVTADVTDCGAALALGDLAAASRALTRWSRVAQSVRLDLLSVVVRLVAAGLALASGKLDELEATLQEQVGEAPQNGAEPENAFLWYAILLAEARDQLALFSALELPTDAPQLRARTLVLPLAAAWLYARTGRSALARERLAAIPALDLARLPSVHGDVGLLCMLAETALALSDHERARTVYEQLAPHARLNAVGAAYESRGCVAHYLGLLAELFGDGATAHAHFAQAVRAHTAWQMPWLLARSQAGERRNRRS